MAPDPEREDPELEALLAETPASVTAALSQLVKAQARYYLNLGDAGLDGALEMVAAALRAQIIESAMLGAREVLKATVKAAPANAATISKVNAATASGMAMGEVAPTRAVAAILKREPRLARTYKQVALLYSRDDTVFAAVRAADITTAAKVQGAIAEALKQGLPSIQASEVIQGLTDWTAAYSDTVFQTNAATAYSDGMKAQVDDPDVRAIMVGMEVLHPVDGDTRPNHAPGAGFRASLDDPRWAVMRPPWGYRCRGSLNFIDRAYAERQGWLDAQGNLKRMEIPAGFHVDEGFRK